MHCTQCGVALADDARFCDGCGAAFGGTAAKGAASNARTVKPKLVLGGVALLVVGGAAAWWHLGQVPSFLPIRVALANRNECLLINPDGKILTRGNDYPGISPGFGDWLAVTSIDPQGLIDGVRFVDSVGVTKIPPIAGPDRFSANWRATAFSPYGFAGLQEGRGGTDGVWGIIGRDGHYVNGKRFTNFIMTGPARAFFQDGGRWGVIDLKAFKSDPQNYVYVTDLEDVAPMPGATLQAVKKDGSWGVMDEANHVSSFPGFTRIITGFSPTFYAGQQGGSWGVFGLDGSTKLSPRYAQPPLVLPHGSAAFAIIDDSTLHKVLWIDEAGNILKQEDGDLRGVYPLGTRIQISIQQGDGTNNWTVFRDTDGKIDWKLPSGISEKSVSGDCIMKPVRDSL